jgi:apolipoprotein N-acyltransferase
MVVDYEGRVLASSDYFATGEQVMIASVPVKGVQTIYALVGDLFAWLYMAGLFLLAAFALVQARKRQAIKKMAPDDTAPVPDPRLVGSSS